MADTKGELELAYFAGFFDGEGCVAIYRKKYVASLTNTDVRPLLRAQELWGGYIATQKASPIRPQDIWRWQIYGRNSRQFLEDILPYSLVKREQIEVYLSVLDILPNGKGQRYQEGAKEIVDLGATRLKALKREAQNS